MVNIIKRPILIAVIGYIIGILWGLYIQISIVLFYFFIAAIYFCINNLKHKLKKKKKNKLKLLSIRRYFRYVKLIIKSNVIALIIFISIISNTIVIFQNKKYETLYKDNINVKVVGIIVSNKQQKEYKDVYKLRVLSVNNFKKYKNTYLYLKIDKNFSNKIEFGDKIEIQGEYLLPEKQRNYGGFDYSKYLKTLKIYGTINANKLEIKSKNEINPIFMISNNISIKIKQSIQNIVKKDIADIFQGLLLGDTSKIDEELQENFRISNISHILAVSGMHISYIILGVNLLLKKAVGKRNTRVVVIIILILYMFITGFSPSIVRSGIMGILVTFSGLIYRKNDIWNSIAISLLIILIHNPYLIMNIGLQFSYLGTIGIIVFHNNILKFLKSIKIRNRKIKYKINRKVIILIGKIKEILAVTLSAQVIILPIMFYHFNIFNPYFFISNILVSLMIGPIIIIGFICIIISFFSIQISKFISIIVTFGIEGLKFISNISNLPFAKIYVPTPSVAAIVIYYILIIISNYLYSIFNSRNLTITQLRIRNLVALIKYKFNQNRKYYIKIICIGIIMILVINFIPKGLKINFVDVGQGDCTFIETPNRKTILIDGGGSLSKEFDVGKSTLLPYILDKGYTKIDYIFISHFDQDHVGGILTIMEELKVGQVIISKQVEDSVNYQEFLKIVREKNINVNKVKIGERITIEGNLYFDNILNNNSIVMRLNYFDFSMLFTGDIEEIAEKKIIEKYKGKEKILKSDIIKIAHHGSKTSSIVNFLKLVKPKVALIAVGKNNKFGHPNEEVLEMLNSLPCEIYRTDLNGEIVIMVKKSKYVEILKFIK